MLATGGFWGWEGWPAVEACAVIVALVIAYLTVRSQIMATTLVVNQYADESDDRRRSQANAVVIYAANPFIPGKGTKAIRYHDMTVTNGSTLPITCIDLWVVAGDTDPEAHLGFIEVLGPGEGIDWMPLPKGREVGRNQSADLRMRFTDASGAVWRKDGIGRLVADDPSEPFPRSDLEIAPARRKRTGVVQGMS